MLNILRQINPSGRLTYYVPDHLGMRRIRRDEALFLIQSGQGVWAGAPVPRQGPPGPPNLR